ncbi:MAG: PAS domain-containing protein, partial [Spirochaetales bacterium]|nr:PAS domain-containing protein [Spirochaetales bacterium]
MAVKDNFILSRNTINLFTLSVLTLLIILEILNFCTILDWGDVFLYITFPTLIVTLVIANLLNRFNKQRGAIHIILTVSFVFSTGTLLFNVHDLYSAIFVAVFISLYPFIISFTLNPSAGVLCGLGEIILLLVVVLYKEQLFGHFSKIELEHVFDMIFITPAILIACISFFSYYFGSNYIRSITNISNSEQNILTIVNSMIDSLIIMDHKMKIINVNASFLKLTGYTHEELINNSPDTLFTNLIRQPEIKKLMKDGKVQNLEKVITTKGGESIPVLFS